MSGTNPAVNNLSNQSMPLIAQGVSFSFNLVAGAQQAIDLTNYQSSGKISGLQTAFIDNSQGTASLSLTVTSNGTGVTCPAGSQGFFPILVSANPQFSVAGVGTAKITFLNVPMPAAIWGGGAGTYTSSGALVVSDSALDSTIANARVGTNPNVAGALVSGSGTTVAAASTQIFAANSARQYLAIQAPASADLWINPNGGTAGVNAADCFRVPANTFYESRNFVSSAAINYYCATGALQFAAFQA